MANTLNLGDGNWATKENSLLGYNSENNNYKPLPFDFSRASSATRVNKDGLIETVGSGEPRIDFKDNTKGALLLEPSRTNLITYSEDFSQWLLDGSQSSPTIISDLNPDGSSQVYQINLNTGGNIYRTISISSSIEYTFSVYIKGVGVGRLILSNAQSTPENYVDFTATSEWQRIELTGSSSSTSIRVAIGSWSNSSANGNIQIYGAQVEQGSYSTSYIPTSGGVVTRLADSCNNGGNEQVINSTEGVLFLDIEITQNSTEVKQTALCNGTTSEAVKILQLSGSTSFRFETVMSSGTNFQKNLTLNPYQRNKCALQYKANDYKVFVNGVKQTVTQRSTVPVNLDRFNFNRGISAADNFYGNIRDVRVYNTALTDQELQALTTI
jgi:hypothetical protein